MTNIRHFNLSLFFHNKSLKNGNREIPKALRHLKCGLLLLLGTRLSLSSHCCKDSRLCTGECWPPTSVELLEEPSDVSRVDLLLLGDTVVAKAEIKDEGAGLLLLWLLAILTSGEFILLWFNVRTHQSLALWLRRATAAAADEDARRLWLPAR